MTLSRFVIRSGSASIELAGSVADAPGSPEVHLTGAVSPMPVDMLKRFWPKFLAGDARKWVLQNVRGGEVLGGKVAVSLEPGELARMQAGAELAPEAVNVELDLANMSLTYIEKLPPILTGNAKMKVSGLIFSVDIPKAKIVLPSGQEIALSEGRYFIPDLRPDPQQAQITFKASSATATALELLDHEPLGYMQAVGHEARRIWRHRHGQLRSRHADARRPQIHGRQAPRRGAPRSGGRLERGGQSQRRGRRALT